MFASKDVPIWSRTRNNFQPPKIQNEWRWNGAMEMNRSPFPPQKKNTNAPRWPKWSNCQLLSEKKRLIQDFYLSFENHWITIFLETRHHAKQLEMMCCYCSLQNWQSLNDKICFTTLQFVKHIPINTAKPKTIHSNLATLPYHLSLFQTTTLPETNMAPESGWLEDDPFLLGFGLSGAFAVTFLGGVILVRWNNSTKNSSPHGFLWRRWSNGVLRHRRFIGGWHVRNGRSNKWALLFLRNPKFRSFEVLVTLRVEPFYRDLKKK